MDLPITLSGRIYLDPESGQYISEIDAWDIATCGDSFEHAVEMTWHMVDAHLAAAKKLGTLETELAKIGVSRLPQGRIPMRFAIGEHEISL